MQPGDPGQILSLQPLRLCNAVRVSQPAVTLVCFQDQKTLCGKFYITGHAGHMEALQTVFRGWMSLGRPGPQDVGNENVPQMVNRAVSSPCPGCGASWDNHLRVCFTQNRSQRWRILVPRLIDPARPVAVKAQSPNYGTAREFPYTSAVFGHHWKLTQAAMGKLPRGRNTS
ncbi:uncharacterized protein LOC122687602 isoform X2 [Cervus elaphus]|uniref:uncharacterized protein LOC122687602 isoform X2 n=1 Tax=Cervus elaphus TaxID=9860 RepID=UPI001CC2DE9D|nr:uncharacterized protein LOC122687602 isoform X2 [Cervus elaphus]